MALKRIILPPVILAVAACIAVPWIISGRVIRPEWYRNGPPAEGLVRVDDTDFGKQVWQGKIHDPQTDFALPYEEVSFVGAEAAILRGWFVPGVRTDAAVVTVHGGGADRRDFLRHLPVFHDAGYPVLLFDCREHGISDGHQRGISLGLREHEDVSAAVHYLKQQRGFQRVAVVGTSQGGASVILAAAKDPAIDVVIAENPFTRAGDFLPSLLANLVNMRRPVAEAVTRTTLWRIGPGLETGPIDVVERIAPRPLLLMHGSGDTWIPAAHSEELFARAGEPKELWIAPKAEHAQLFNMYPDEWRARVTLFLNTYLPLPQTTP